MSPSACLRFEANSWNTKRSTIYSPKLGALLILDGMWLLETKTTGCRIFEPEKRVIVNLIENKQLQIKVYAIKIWSYFSTNCIFLVFILSFTFNHRCSVAYNNLRYTNMWNCPNFDGISKITHDFQYIHKQNGIREISGLYISLQAESCRCCLLFFVPFLLCTVYTVHASHF